MSGFSKRTAAFVKSTAYAPPLPTSPREGHASSPKEAVATGQTAVDLDVPPLLPSCLPEFTDAEAFLRQWQAIGFSSAGHPML